MFIDTDTKILLLPLPESKREVKIKDTKYELKTPKDVLDKNEIIQTSLKSENKSVENKRFEDKTKEEIYDDMMKKR